MHPILLRLGPVTIYSYGVFVALGFAAAAFLIYRRAARYGVDKDFAMDLLVISLVAGIAGARLLYVALNLPYYRTNPAEIFDLSRGGLIWYGGFFSALAAAIIYMKRKRADPWNTMDLLAPYIALAQGLGRIGCFLNGCCYGTGGMPVQIYSSLLLFVIFMILMLWQKVRRFTGEIFLAYCVLYSFKRFGMEFLRGDNPGVLFGLTLSQAISLAVISIALPAFIVKSYRWSAKGTASK